MTKHMHHLPPSVQLLTLLNVSAARPAQKRKAEGGEEPVSRDWIGEAKRALAAKKLKQAAAATIDVTVAQNGSAAVEDDDEQDLTETATANADSFATHFSPDNSLLSEESIACPESRAWKRKKLSDKQVDSSWGQIVSLDNPALPDESPQAQFTAKLASKRATLSERTNAFLDLLATYRDVQHSNVQLDEHDSLREAASAHAMNHVLKTRSRILKNNEHLSKVAADPSAHRNSVANTQDQGFTRPKVLILAPLRNSALAWLIHLAAFAGVSTIEQLERFRTEFNLPDGTPDALADNADEYPEDHVATFSGNIDDTFRVGLKMTRKTMKLFSEFYSSDIIIASPLGLRTSIEKDDDGDFLSSIEMLVIDQADVMLMQNWEHVQFVLQRLNEIPTNTRDTDFSRVKPWYLEDRSRFLRQSIVLSAFDSPEVRAAVTSDCQNVAGKLKIEGPPSLGVLDRLPKGYKQTFHRFENVDVQKDDDARFEFFTQKILPMLRKSAVSSSQTLIIVPSYFDFVRLKRHLKTLPDLSYAAISEYSPVPDVSRARGAFFDGRADLMVVTERFHFFRRYRIRGAKTFVFYGPPEHAAYYAEILNFPFRKPGPLAASSSSRRTDDETADLDELSAVTVFSQFDRLKLERICGKKEAKKMTQGVGERKFSFV